MTNNNLRKNFIWNIIGTTLNAFNSLFFMIIVTRINGINQAGIFTFAFSTATLLNVIGVYSGRVYQVTDSSDISDKEYIINKVFTCSVMIFITIFFLISNRYNLFKSAVILVLCLLKCLEAFCEVIYAIFQKRELLYKVGISLTMKSLIGLLIFMIINLLTKNILFASIGLLISFIIMIIVYDYYNLKKINIEMRVDIKNVKKILVIGIFPFLVTFLCLFIINAAKYSIDINLSNKDQTIYGILIMPATIILLFGQFIIHPFLVKITHCININDYKQLSKIVTKFILWILIFGIIASICVLLLGIPVLQIIYGISLIKYKIALLLIIIGASFYGIVSILSNILIAMRHYKIQTIILFITSIFTFLLSFYLTKVQGIYGAVLSYFFTMILLCITYIIIMIFYLNKMKGSEINEKNNNVSSNT